jgi:hypothetical protein
MPKHNLTPDDLKAIRNIFETLVKKLSSSSSNNPSPSDIGNIVSAVTAMRVIQEGLASVVGGLDEVSEKFKKAVDNSDSTTFIENLRKAFESSAEDSKKFTKILDEWEDIFKGNNEALQLMLDNFDKLSTVTETFTSETLDTTEAFSDLVSMQSELLAKMSRQKIAGKTQIEILQNQIKSSSALGDLLDYQYVEQDKLNQLMADMQNMMANPSDELFTMMGNSFNFKDAMANFKIFRKQMADGIDAESSRFDALSEDITKEILRKTKNLTLDETQNKVIYSEDMTSPSGDYNVQGEQANVSIKKYNKLLETTKATIEKIATEMSSSVGLTEKQISAYKKQFGEEVFIAAEMMKQTMITKSQLKLTMDQVDATEKLAITTKKYHKILKSADDVAESIIEQYDSLLSLLPEGIVKFAGLDKVSEKMTENLENANTAFIDIATQTGSKMQAWKGYIAELTGGLGKLFTPLTVGLATFGALLEITHSYEDAVKNIATNFGMSVTQAQKLYKANMNLLQSSSNQITTMESALAIQEELNHTTGQLYDAAAPGADKLVTSLDKIGMAFGFGGVQAAKMHDVFETLGATDQFGAALTADVALMAEAANISPKIISDDLINNAEDLALYFGNMPNQAKNAVVQIQKMGFQFEKAGQLIQKTWNIDSFLTDMYELQAMSGIDLSKTFESGLTGDAEGVIKNTLDAIGSIDKFNQMNIQSQKKLSDTTGLSVEDLRKSLMLKQKGLKLTQKEQDQFARAGLTSQQISEYSAEEINKKIESVGLSDKMNASWDRIKYSLMKSVLPLAEKFAHVLESLIPAIDVVGKLIAGFLKPITLIVEGISWAYDKIKKWISPLESVNSEASMMGTALSGISTIAYGLGTALGTVFVAMKGLNVASWVASKIMPNVFSPALDGAKKMVGSLDLGGKAISAIKEKALKMAGILPKMFGFGDKTKEAITDIANDKIKDTAKDKLSKVSKRVLPNRNEKGQFTKSVKPTPIETINTKGVEASTKSLEGSRNIIEKISGTIKTVVGDLVSILSDSFVKIMDSAGKGIGAFLKGLATDLAALSDPRVLLGIVGLTGAIVGYGFALKLAAPGIEALGNLLTKLGDAMVKIIGTIGTVVLGVFDKLNESLKTLVNTDPKNIFLLGGAMLSLAAGLDAVGLALTGSAALSGLSGIFGGGMLETLGDLSKMASPLESVDNTIMNLGKSIENLAKALNSINIDALKKLSGIDLSNLTKIPINDKDATALPPPRESTAQHVKINSVGNSNNSVSGDINSDVDSYLSNRNSSNVKTEKLLQEILVAFKQFADRPNEVIIDTTNIKKIHSVMKALNNNR